MASIAQRFDHDISLSYLCTNESLDEGPAAEILNWLADEVHHDFNATVPRLTTLPAAVQARMALYVGWLIAESKAGSLHEHSHKLVKRVSTVLKTQQLDAACPMLKAIWRALEDALCIEHDVPDYSDPVCAQHEAHVVSGRQCGAASQ